MSTKFIAYRTNTWPPPAAPAAVVVPQEDRTQVYWGDDAPPDIQPGQAIVFTATAWDFTLPVGHLHTQENIRLTFEIHLRLRLADPHAFWLDVMQREDTLTEEAFKAYLTDLLRQALAPTCNQSHLNDLDRPGIRQALAHQVQAYLYNQADIHHRSGLDVEQVEVQSIRFTAQRGEALEDLYLFHSLPPERRGHVRVADSQMFTWVREAASRPTVPASVWRAPSSIWRPERWRHRLGGRVVTAPLLHRDRLYVATEDGTVWAFERLSREGDAGSAQWEPAWDTPAHLPARPGAGMVIAAQTLWIPGEDGILYGVRLSDGRIARQIEIRGRLRSAPTVVGDALYIATDRPKGTFSPEGGGRLVKVDPWSGGIVKEVPISSRGFRAQPIQWGEFLLLSDRRNVVYRVDLNLEHVESWRLKRVGRLLAGVAVDKEHDSIIAVDGAPGYGWVITLDIRGQERARTQLPGTIINPPLVWKGQIFVPVSGEGRRGYLFRLDPRTLHPVDEPIVTDGRVTASPVGFEDIVIFGSHDGLVYAVWADSGKLFWKFHSGNRVIVPPAVSEDGIIFVVDEGGNINALPWYCGNSVEAARWSEERGRVEEAVRLWEEAGDVEMAMEVAEEKKRWRLAAEVAHRYGYYERAAWYYQQLAEFLKRRRRRKEAAKWWYRAAEVWKEIQEWEKRHQCLKEAALAEGWPLLWIEPLNKPQVRQGEMAQIELEIQNIGGGPAKEVEVEIRGTVLRAERKLLPGIIERKQRRQVTLPVYPSESGMARLRVYVRYRSPGVRQEFEEYREIILFVDREPEVHYHYHGTHVSIGKDGVVILRGEGGEVHADIGGDGVVFGGSRGRHIDFQMAGDDEERVGSPGEVRYCPRCGAAILDEYKFCVQCGYRLRE